MQDARQLGPGDAAERFAAVAGVPTTDVRAWKRHVEVFTLAQRWATARRADVHDEDVRDDETARVSPPPGWSPPEWQPSWRFVSRAHPAGRPVWVCGLRGGDAPRRP
ncbi:hypothetical protein AB0L40_11450 [Patulibacter sp. NPDC049589]|uniref:hypothetical protein n=1 Tax=Patulibacter sp. NPDC049589 TaxID=3154731 RepID=UPI0034188CBC